VLSRGVGGASTLSVNCSSVPKTNFIAVKSVSCGYATIISTGKPQYASGFYTYEFIHVIDVFCAQPIMVPVDSLPRVEAYCCTLPGNNNGQTSSQMLAARQSEEHQLRKERHHLHVRS